MPDVPALPFMGDSKVRAPFRPVKSLGATNVGLSWCPSKCLSAWSGLVWFHCAHHRLGKKLRAPGLEDLLWD